MPATIILGETARAYPQVCAAAARAASALDGIGIGPDRPVAIMLRNDFAFFEVSLAAALLGAYAVQVNWHFRAEEAGYVLRDSGARALVIHEDLVAGVEAGIPPDVALLVVPTPACIRGAYAVGHPLPPLPARAARWAEWIAGHAPWGAPPRPPRGAMVYTSGTTGRPKGVKREPAVGAARVVAERVTAMAMGLRDGEPIRAVITGPLYHQATNTYALSAARLGDVVVLQPRFDAEQLLRWIERYRITHLHMVPTMFVRLLKLSDATRRRYDVSSLRFVVHGAAPCPAEIKRAMIDWWGPVINEYYGGTETGCVVFHTAEEALRKPGTVGRPLPGAEVRIFAPDGRELGPGEIGEIYMRTRGFPDFTYHGMPDKRAEVERDGLISCGDIGYRDADGYLYLCDRARDMVISGGVNIYPAEIEAALVSMPGVRDCAVFGIPDAEYGESLCACVEPAAGAKLGKSDVEAWLRARLAAYKVPRRIEFHASLPREDTGKIFKRRLREPFWKDAGRRI